MRKTRKRTASEPQGAALPPLHPPFPIRLDAIALRHLEYRELRPPNEMAPTTDAALPLEVGVEATVNFFENDAVEYMLQFSIKPDPRQRPLEIIARVAAIFSRDDGIDNAYMLRWLNQMGVLIVFPYVREVVSSVTMRGVYGGLLLNPLPLNAVPEISGEFSK